VDVGAAFVADEQPFELVQPGEAALDDPAVAAEAGAVLGLAAGDLGFDPALPEQPAVLVVVVAAVGAQPLWPPTRSTDDAAHARHGVDQRDQLGDVVAVAAREREGKRESARIDEEVVLRAGSASVHRARARFGAPFFACT
jgi:hypothetical protein